ncbi:MAG: DUF3460 family protein [Pseudomonadota bacterium]
MPQTKMYRPKHSGYVSEFSRFLGDFLDQHPHVREDQRRGWYIFWDHHVDLSEQDRLQRERLPAKGYAYD